MTPVVSSDVQPEVERVSPFSLFPGVGVASPDEGDIFEVHNLSRAELQSYIGVDGYSEDAIRAALEEYGNGGLKSWLWTVTDEEETVADGSLRFKTDEETIDALELWGSVQGSFLETWGLEGVDDPEGEYQVNIWLVGNYVIRAALNPDPLGRKPYHCAAYERVPGSFWGKAPAEVIEDIQDVCNATARALVNNMAFASGPQAEVNVDRVTGGEDIYSIFPLKVWPVSSDMTSTAGGAPAVRFFQPDSNAGILLQVFQYFSKLADDYLGIPSYAYGSSMNLGGAGRTSSGLQTLLGNAAKGIRQVVGNIDRAVSGVVGRFYDFNMRYDEDPNIKGDLKVHAKGSSVLVAREQQKQLRAELLQLSANPIDVQLFGAQGRAELWKEMLRSADIKPEKIIPVPDRLTEVEQQIAQMAQSQTTIGGWRMPQGEGRQPQQGGPQGPPQQQPGGQPQ